MGIGTVGSCAGRAAYGARAYYVAKGAQAVMSAQDIYQTVQAASAAVESARQGDWKGALANGASALLGAFTGLDSIRAFRKACFAAGTPILTPGGSRAIEELRPGDLVLSLPEDDPEGVPRPRRVEETFRLFAPLLELRVEGRSILTTAEHPFWVRGRGWVAAQHLEAGDEFRGHDGQWLPFDQTLDGLGADVVYNLQVAEDHTYFVGCDQWGFSVWAHNSNRCIQLDGDNSYDVLGELEFFHKIKPHKVTDMVELNDQIQGQVMRMNEIIQTKGLAGLKARVRAYDSTVEAAGRSHVKTLPQPSKDMAWLHEPDMRTGGLPTDVFRQGSKRTNSIIGGQANRIAQDILNLPDNVTKITFKLTLR